VSLADQIRQAATAAVVRIATRQRIGVVVTASPLTVTLGGDTAAVSAATANGYLPVVGETVAVLVTPGAVPLVLGGTAVRRAAGDLVEFVPAGNTDTGSSGTFATWITLGNITVPAGFTAARYSVTVSGVYAITASPTGLFLRLTVGGVTAAHQTSTTSIDVTNQPRADRAWQGRITGLSAGSRSVVIQYQKGVGTGALRADTSSLITVAFEWEL
jgi:hypothetical protein